MLLDQHLHLQQNTPNNFEISSELPSKERCFRNIIKHKKETIYSKTRKKTRDDIKEEEKNVCT